MASVELGRDGNASLCLYFIIKKKVLKVSVEENHIPNYPVVYGKLRQHSGMH